MSFGCGGILSKQSAKQKLNPKSSAEAKFFNASNSLPNAIWDKNFLEAGGTSRIGEIFERDNASAIRLEENGHMSAAPNKSRQIGMRCFRLNEWQFLTKKPLQGNLFRKICNVITGEKHVNTLAIDQPMPTEERVGKTCRQLDDGASECMNNHTTGVVTTMDLGQ